ncbi:hypothetical protein TPHA_0A05230 [Tetrapisispora phaffii CBS 4417]|uniref:2',3'-cyclic-nucleotide 3'-phosphodiesterase n=1 Tax=Tetrapisispora phaffii (strain ATCC 24235 / CBS 4417 / NBRC 1672 / NRRL Y-8282 / UCD 70-5) TaxID=1071381 RepID=G8BNX0_TETPH|nr:hypothetical protein TPHA_0A05230 [Tetrapisispora phaffii CBS 4417]CCE61598.1 hypothetical protein TPHA_0A05230 [Tetrapisispora phaffii CBS 4417]
MAVSLWFCPSPGTHTYDILMTLTQSIQSLFPNSPTFEPHITLTSNLALNSDPDKSLDDVNKILTYCVAAMNSIKKQYMESLTLENNGLRLTDQLVSFKNLCIGKKYFSKIFLQCKENRYLYSVASIMREMFVEVTDNEMRAKSWLKEDFLPHLSLLYSDVPHLSKADERAVVTRIEDIVDIKLRKESIIPTIMETWSNKEKNNIQVKYSFSETPSTLAWGLPGTLKVVRCVGPVDEWEVLGKIDV